MIADGIDAAIRRLHAAFPKREDGFWSEVHRVLSDVPEHLADEVATELIDRSGLSFLAIHDVHRACASVRRQDAAKRDTQDNPAYWRGLHMSQVRWCYLWLTLPDDHPRYAVSRDREAVEAERVLRKAGVSLDRLRAEWDQIDAAWRQHCEREREQQKSLKLGRFIPESEPGVWAMLPPVERPEERVPFDDEPAPLDELLRANAPGTARRMRKERDQ